MLGVRGVERARMLVRRAVRTLGEHLPHRPLSVWRDHPRLIADGPGRVDAVAHAYAASDACLARCLAAYALAASRTHAPSSCARRRASRRSRLHGPLPRITWLNSSQSIGPKCQFSVSASYRSSGSGSVRFTATACGTV